MAEEKIHFIFTLSSEGTKMLKEGTLTLSSGGLRNPDGSLFEMAKPCVFDPDSIPLKSEQEADAAFKRLLEDTTEGLYQTIQGVNALKDIAWMDYAVNCRIYGLTYQGFEQIIGKLDDISAQLSRIERKHDNKEFNDRLEIVNKYKNKLKSIAGFMEIRNFNPSDAYFNVTDTLDEIEAYFERLHNELKTGTGNIQLVMPSIFILIGSYAYVVRRYSALYYYENNCYPPNYEKWVDAVSNITKDFSVREKFLYYLRMNLDCSLEDVYIARSRAWLNLEEFVSQIDFDHSYVLQHTKEEYLSIDRQLQDKIEQKDYRLINGHLCIEL